MVKPKQISADDMGQLLGLLVHDLRNPAATISANFDFLQEVGFADDDSVEALQDVRLAMGELRRGLDLVAWISRWLSGEVPLEAMNGDVGMFVERLGRSETSVPMTAEIARDDQLYAHGAQVAVEVVELLLRNTRANVSEPHATVRVYQQSGQVVVEVEDAGEAIAPELRATAFTLEGQKALKGRLDGRYSRFVGLFAAAAVLDGVGGTIEADGEKGAAVFRIHLPGARPTRPPRD